MSSDRFRPWLRKASDYKSIQAMVLVDLSRALDPLPSSSAQHVFQIIRLRVLAQATQILNAMII